jgi:hypothetical protein
VRSPRAIRAARSDTLVLFQVDMWRRGCRTTRRRRDRSRTWRRGARSEACASGRRDQESPSIHRERRVRPRPMRAIGGAPISTTEQERAMSRMSAWIQQGTTARHSGLPPGELARASDGRVTVALAGRRAGGSVRARAPRLGCSALGDGLLTNACSIVPRARYVAIRSSRSGTTTSRRRGRPKCSRPSRATAESPLASAASTGWRPTSSSARTATGGHGPPRVPDCFRGHSYSAPLAPEAAAHEQWTQSGKVRCRCRRPTRLSRVSRPERRSSLV